MKEYNEIVEQVLNPLSQKSLKEEDRIISIE